MANSQAVRPLEWAEDKKFIPCGQTLTEQHEAEGQTQAESAARHVVSCGGCFDLIHGLQNFKSSNSPLLFYMHSS